MTYASKQDLIDRFGLDELVRFTDRVTPPARQVDDTVVDRALSDADSKINGYLASRVTTPLATVPGIVNGWACVIARYFLAADRATDRIRQDYEDALADLQQFAKGNISLGDTTAPTEPNSAGAPDFIQGRATFDRFTLRDY